LKTDRISYTGPSREKWGKVGKNSEGKVGKLGTGIYSTCPQFPTLVFEKESPLEMPWAR